MNVVEMSSDKMAVVKMTYSLKNIFLGLKEDKQC
jgi:hypothetical protein